MIEVCYQPVNWRLAGWQHRICRVWHRRGRLDAVWQGGFRGGRAVAWLRGRASLRVRLLAAALCLLIAGAAVITWACGLVVRGYLIGRADQQLRAFTGRLISRPFVASPLYGLAPGVPGAPGGPGGLAPGTASPAGGALGIEVRASGGQLVMRTSPGAQPGPVIPAVPAGAAARAGQEVTVAAEGGGDSWRVITEPIRYRARHIPFSYSAEGFSVFIASHTRTGLAGTLVVGLDLGGIGPTVGRLTDAGLAVAGMVALVAACLGAAMFRAILRPVTKAEATLAAAAAGKLSLRVPGRHGGGDAGRLASSLNEMFRQLDRALGARAASEAAARRSAERMSRRIADAGHQLRGPLSVIHGIAEASRRGGRLGAGELDRVMRRVTREAARADALVDDLLPARHDPPQPPQPPQR